MRFKFGIYLLLSIAALSVLCLQNGAYGETVRIGIDDPDVQFSGYVSEVEVDQGRQLLYIGYSTMGFSVFDPATGSLTNIDESSTPSLTSGIIDTMLYEPYLDLLFLAVDNYQDRTRDLNVYDPSAETMDVVVLDDYPTIYSMTYVSSTDTLYLGTDAGLVLIDITDLGVIGYITEMDGLIPGEVRDLQYIPSLDQVWAGISSYNDWGIQFIDAATNMPVQGQGIYPSGGTRARVGSTQWNAEGLQSFLYNEVTDETYMGFGSITDPDTDETHYLGYVPGTDIAGFQVINTSIYDIVDPGYGQGEVYYHPGGMVTEILSIRSGSEILLSMTGTGTGVVDVSDHSVELVVQESYTVSDEFQIPYFTGGYDIAYQESTDTCWLAFFVGLGGYDPDETLIIGGTLPDDDTVPDDDMVADDDTEVDEAKGPGIEIDLCIIGAGGEDDTEELGDKDVMGPGEKLRINAYTTLDPMGSSGVDHLVLEIKNSRTGEVVRRETSNQTFMETDVDTSRLSSGTYTVEVKAVSREGETVATSERSIFIDNPVSEPITGTVLAVGVALAAGAGAGLAFSTLTTSGVSAATGSAGSSAVSSSATVPGTGNWKNMVFGFVSEYSEEQLKDKTASSRFLTDERRSFITVREVLAMLVTAVFLMIAYGYAEMMGLLEPNETWGIGGLDIVSIPEFSLSSLIIVIPMVLFSSVIMILAIELVEELSARALGLWSEFRIWPIGIATMIFSAFFLMPFGYPGRAQAKGDVKITPAMEAYIGSCVLFTIMALMLPFSAIYLIAYLFRGSAAMDILMSFGALGLSICTMVYMAGVLPFKPMDGSRLWRFNKMYLIIMLVFGALLFWIWNFRILPLPPVVSDWIVYIPGWISALVLMAFGISALVIVILLALAGIYLAKDHRKMLNDYRKKAMVGKVKMGEKGLRGRWKDKGTEKKKEKKKEKTGKKVSENEE